MLTLLTSLRDVTVARATDVARHVDDDLLVVVGEDLAQDVMNIVEERRRNRRRYRRNSSPSTQ